MSDNSYVPIKLPVLSLIKDKHLHYGLRHGDYQRYQQYVTRKLHRLRKSLHFPQGDRRRVISKVITPQLASKDARYLHIKLFQAERAWARSNQLKAEANSDTRKRFHQASRMRKAVKHADELCTLALSNIGNDPDTCVPLCDARSKLEVQAYAAYMQGLQQFELASWHKAKELMETSQNIYRGLAEAVDEDDRAIYISRVDDLTPQIRYSAYNIGDQQAERDLRAMRHDQLDSGVELDELLSQARANQAQAVIEVIWLPNLMVSVKNEKARLAVLAAQDAANELDDSATPLKSKLAMYESIMKTCVEAMSAVRDEIRVDPNQKTLPNLTVTAGQNLPPEKMSRLQLLYTYLAYLKQTHTLDRNIALIQLAAESTSAKPQEMARLYDTVTQTLQELLLLPGVHQHSPTQEDLEARLQAYKAWRCYYLAHTYMTNKKFTEAGALLKRVKQRYTKHGTDVLTPLLKSSASQLKLHSIEASVGRLLQSMEELDRLAEADELACRANHVLSMVQDDHHHQYTDNPADGDNKEAQRKKPLEDRVDIFLEDSSVLTKTPNLLNLPPDFEPVSAKPIFFDLALNHVQYPLEHEKFVGGKKAATGAASGLMGWLWRR